MIFDTLITILISILILVAEHYWPWGETLGRQLHNLERYIAGVLAMVLPYIGLLLVWRRIDEVLALVCIVLISGGVVSGLYALDGWFTVRNRANAAELAEKRLKDGTLHNGKL